MAHLTYKTQGTCSQLIDIEVGEDGRVERVRFAGGCQGNTQGVCSLVRGMQASEARKRLQGIQCGQKGTSCPDQLARALAEMGY